MSKTTFNRRRFLMGAGSLGAVSLAIPALPSLARAEPNPPKRLVVFFSGNGTIGPAWTPQSSNGMLTSMGRILKPLEPMMSKINVVEGLDITCAKSQYQPKGGFHAHERGLGGILTGHNLNLGNQEAGSGYANGISVDQYIANRLNMSQETSTDIHSLQLGMIARRDHSSGWYNRRTMTYRGADAPIFAQSDGQKVFDEVFKGQDVPDRQWESIKARRRSVLDFVKDDFQRLLKKISSEDGHRLKYHADAFADMERDLQDTMTNTCMSPQRPGADFWFNQDRMDDISRIQIDQAVRALSCDLTRVTTMQFGSGLGALDFRVMGNNARGSWHSASHQDKGDPARDIEMLTQLNTYIARRFAYLIQRMDETDDGDGSTLLDNSVVLWVNEMGKGNSHDHNDVPIIMAGRAGGFFKGGGRHYTFGARSTNDLLITLCHAMGFGDVTEFGIPSLCTGPITEMMA